MSTLTRGRGSQERYKKIFLKKLPFSATFARKSTIHIGGNKKLTVTDRILYSYTTNNNKTIEQINNSTIQACNNTRNTTHPNNLNSLFLITPQVFRYGS